MVFYSHFFQNFLQFAVIHTVKGFGVVSKAEVGIFLVSLCFFYDPTDVGNLISGSSVFSKSSFNIWKFSVHILLKPCLQNFLVSYDPRRGFSVVSEEVETFPEYSFFFYDPMGVGNLISGSSVNPSCTSEEQTNERDVQSKAWGNKVKGQ